MLPSYLRAVEGGISVGRPPIVDHGNLFRHGLQGLMPVIGKRGVAPKTLLPVFGPAFGIEFYRDTHWFISVHYFWGC
ncbi:Uncharacterised protein [Serratia fonticola]|uniref:Uncharacterized protein n=1 Tax=Serratia fonticola TaxID=47917 RepID=A0A4V6KMN6_SERFO|nr:Uncharacterised protein [Serratia fonticola]